MSAVLAPERTRPAGGPGLRLVAPPRRRHTVVFAAVTLLLSAVAVFTTVAVNALAAGDAVAARALEERVSRAEQRYGELVAEVARLEDPARVERVAVEDLGMVPARQARFVVLDPEVGDDLLRAAEIAAGSRPDPLKPVLSVDR